MSRLSRRVFITTGAAAVGGGAIYAAGGQNVFYALITEEITGEFITPDKAHELAEAGKVTLIDIRRPDEWEKTGYGEGAQPLDMRRDDFIDALDQLIDGKRDAPVALICARGVRSARLNNQLVEAGFTNIIDVPEGMLGNSKGPGWIKRGLPLLHP